ncbi:ABC transporter substrate-binding protein [candidate division KSB1 bacterium]|nr:ABC transporter substrate-binding protein [candidate division KSB1 bacterium]
MKKMPVIFLLLILFISYNYAATPEQIVKKLVNAIKLKKYGPNLTAEEQEHNLKMTRIAATCFDLEKMAKTALADHWKDIQPQIQQQLIHKINDLVIKLAYPATNPDVQKIQIVYKGQNINGDQAIVNSLLIVKDKELQIDYKLYRSGNNWLIYDILSEKRSLIEDYKKQFNTVIETYSVGKLLEILDKKLEGK